MQVVTTVQATRDAVNIWKKQGLRVGLVPTMGYLHQGHASLIRRAAEECDRVVVSIFVNPTQFGPGEDLEAYPRDMDGDTDLCRSLGVGLVFAPEPSEMYPDGFSTFVEVGRLGENLCGRSRPIHFRGVCTVVSKLFTIVAPQMAFFGQKDAQQCAILKRMVRDMNMDIQLVACPIVRHEDGLAISSRNYYLNQEERKAALVVQRAITVTRELFLQGERKAAVLVQSMRDVIATEPLARLDYAEVVDAETLAFVSTVNHPALAALAVFFGKTRLIDNTALELKPSK